MIPRILRRLGYAWLVIQGALATIAPRVGVALNLKPVSLAFENVDELDPREWYVRAVRAAGVGMLAAGVAGLLLESMADDPEPETNGPESEADSTEGAEERE